MDISQTRTITWDAPTTRTNGVGIVGTLSYFIDVVDNVGNVRTFTDIASPYEINFQSEGFSEGNYVLYVRAQEDYQGMGRVSARSNGFPLALELIMAPNPPTNIMVE